MGIGGTAEEKCQDVAVWGSIVLLLIGVITCVFIAPERRLEDNGFGGVATTRTFNVSLFAIFLIGVVLVIAVGLVGTHLARAIRELHDDQRQAARAAATQHDTTA